MRRALAAAWPGFRGPKRDSVIHGVRIATDWTTSPPVELWRRPIGPGWSSFAVAGDRFFTQEQRGDEEIVSAYSLATGELIWRHQRRGPVLGIECRRRPARDARSYSNGRVYSLGGTGILNALDARDGSVVWSRNAVSDTGQTIPDWGIASSPLVVGEHGRRGHGRCARGLRRGQREAAMVGTEGRLGLQPRRTC